MCETRRADVATTRAVRRPGGCAMRAAVTRGGRLVVGEVPDPRPVLGPRGGALAGRRHLRFRPARAGRLPAFHRRSWTRSACPRSTPPPTACSATSSAPRSSSTAPTPPAPCPWERGSARCRSSLGPDGVEQIGYSNAYPGALAEHMVLQELLLPAGARRARHRPGRADRAAGRRRARRRPGGAARGPALPGGRLRAGRPRRHRRAARARPRPGPGRRLLADPAPPGRGLRGRRGHRPGRGVAARSLARLRHRRARSWSASGSPCSAAP